MSGAERTLGEQALERCLEDGWKPAEGIRSILRLRVARAALRARGERDSPGEVIMEANRLRLSCSRPADARAPGLFCPQAPRDLRAVALLLQEEGLFDPCSLGDSLEELRTLRSLGERKRSGSYYTAHRLARSTAQRVLEPLRGSPLRVLDPACGGGAFLTAAFDLLVEQERSPGEAAEALYGIDLDPLAVDCTRAAIWLAVGDWDRAIDADHGRIVCGHALLGWSAQDGADYPLAAWDRKAGDERHPIGAPHARGTWNRRLLEVRREVSREFAAGNAGGCEPVTTAIADRWCSLWFWPIEDLDLAPRPSCWGWAEERWKQEAPATLAQVEAISKARGFLHQGLVWPEVERAGGFDAVLGNPPWEVSKPDSKQWFSERIEEYRSLSKSEAVEQQVRLFQSEPDQEHHWLEHLVQHRAENHWHRARSQPSEDDRGDSNRYARFVEQSLQWLRPGGRMGWVVPTGVVSDRGTRGLRKRLLGECRWEWIFGFENTHGLFDIHRSYSFGVLIAEKGGPTESLRAVFGRTAWEDWEEPGELAHHWGAADIQRMSPAENALIPFRDKRDAELYERILQVTEPLGSSDWNVRYRREFDMTLDSPHFRAREGFESAGIQPDGHERWVDPGSGEAWLPLYQGSMVRAYDYAAKEWQDRRWVQGDHRIRSRYLVREETYHRRRPERGPKLVFRDVARSTDERSLMAALVPDLPCGNVLPVLECVDGQVGLLALLNSFVTDWLCRQRLSGAHLNWYWMQELPVLPRRVLETRGVLVGRALELVQPHPGLPGAGRGQGPSKARLLRAAIEAELAELYGLDADDLAWILRDCDHPFPRDLLCQTDPRGFWRVDRSLPPQRRSTNLALRLFRRRVSNS